MQKKRVVSIFLITLVIVIGVFYFMKGDDVRFGGPTCYPQFFSVPLGTVMPTECEFIQQEVDQDGVLLDVYSCPTTWLPTNTGTYGCIFECGYLPLEAGGCGESTLVSESCAVGYQCGSEGGACTCEQLPSTPSGPDELAPWPEILSDDGFLIDSDQVYSFLVDSVNPEVYEVGSYDVALIDPNGNSYDLSEFNYNKRNPEIVFSDLGYNELPPLIIELDLAEAMGYYSLDDGSYELEVTFYETSVVGGDLHSEEDTLNLNMRIPESVLSTTEGCSCEQAWVVSGNLDDSQMPGAYHYENDDVFKNMDDGRIAFPGLEVPHFSLDRSEGKPWNKRELGPYFSYNIDGSRKMHGHSFMVYAKVKVPKDKTIKDCILHGQRAKGSRTVFTENGVEVRRTLNTVPGATMNNAKPSAIQKTPGWMNDDYNHEKSILEYKENRIIQWLDIPASSWRSITSDGVNIKEERKSGGNIGNFQIRILKNPDGPRLRKAVEKNALVLWGAEIANDDESMCECDFEILTMYEEDQSQMSFLTKGRKNTKCKIVHRTSDIPGF
jgi:hypothetical protein